MSRLVLSLLGPFQARLDEQPIAGFRSDKARALLAYLAVEAGRPHARQALAALFWPDSAGGAALAYLRAALSNLRHLLGDRAAGCQPFLLVTRETLQLNPAADVWLDVAAFAALDGQVPGQHCLERAVSLYRGPFLEGLSIVDSAAFDEWLLISREHYNRQVTAAFQSLAELALQQHRYADAESYSRRQLALEPWDEAAHRQVMSALALAGNRTAALHHYASWHSRLAEELGVEPADATAELHDHIRAGHLEPHPEPVASPSPLFVDGFQDLAPFVARAAELIQLDRALDLALDGAGRVLFVRGDAGSGKTALLYAFLRRASLRRDALLVAEGRCTGYGGGGDAYLPFREIMQMLARAAGSGELGLPGSAGWLGRPPAPTPESAGPAGPGVMAQSDFFEHVTSFLLGLAHRRPLILLLDDLQWVDRGSINLLFHLSRRVVGNRILVVGAYRPEDVVLDDERQRHPLVAVVHEIQRQFGDPAIDLDRIDGRMFVGALLASEPNRLGDAFCDTLYRHTEGHALFTVELLRAMKERGVLVQDAGGIWVEGRRPDWESLPPRVEAVVAERIERLPRRLRSLLEAAAVEGELFSVEVLARLFQAGESQLAWSIGELLGRRHHLVRAETHLVMGPQGQRLVRYRFAHSLYQTYLYGHLDPVRRAYLHRQVGEALEGLYGAAAGRLAVPLAWHFEQAGSLSKAIDYYRLSGDQAMQSSTCEAAISHYSHALTLLAQLPASPERSRQELALHVALSAPLTMMRGWGSEEARAAIVRACELCRAIDDRKRLAETMLLLSSTYAGRGELAKALEVGAALMHLAQQGGEPFTLALAHFALGEALFFSGALLPARLHLEQVTKLLADQLPETQMASTPADLGVAAHVWLALTLLQSGYPQQAIASRERALARAQALAQPQTTAVAVSLAGAMFDMMLGDLPSAQQYAERVLQDEVLKELVLPRIVSTIVVAFAETEQGQSELGIARIRQAVSEWLALGTVGGRIQHMVTLARACLIAGHTELGLATVEAALHLAPAEQDNPALAVAELWRIRGELLLQQGAGTPTGDPEACFLHAIELARLHEARLWELRATVSLARLWQAHARTGEAFSLLAAIYGWFSEGFDTPDLKDARALLAQLAPAGARR